MNISFGFTVSSALAKHSPSRSCTAKSVKRILRFVLYNFPYCDFTFLRFLHDWTRAAPAPNWMQHQDRSASPILASAFLSASHFFLSCQLVCHMPHATRRHSAHNSHAASCGFSLAGQLTSGNSRIQLATCNLQVADAPVVFDRFVWLMADPNRLPCLKIH